MIKINLAKSGKETVAAAAANVDGLESVSSVSDRQVASQGLVRLFILILGPALLWIYQNNVVIPEKTALLSQKQKNLAALKQKNSSAESAVAEMKNYEESESRLRDQINVIESLKKDRMREVRVLDLVQREMPDHMWFKKVEMREGHISLAGFAGTDADLTLLMDNLNKSGFLKDVNLIRTNDQMIEGNNLKEFSIDCTFPKLEIKAGGGKT